MSFLTLYTGENNLTTTLHFQTLLITVVGQLKR